MEVAEEKTRANVDNRRANGFKYALCLMLFFLRTIHSCWRWHSACYYYFLRDDVLFLCPADCVFLFSFVIKWLSYHDRQLIVITTKPRTLQTAAYRRITYRMKFVVRCCDTNILVFHSFFAYNFFTLNSQVTDVNMAFRSDTV